jgi:hypothetical protein
LLLLLLLSLLLLLLLSLLAFCFLLPSLFDPSFLRRPSLLPPPLLSFTWVPARQRHIRTHISIIFIVHPSARTLTGPGGRRRPPPKRGGQTQGNRSGVALDAGGFVNGSKGGGEDRSPPSPWLSRANKQPPPLLSATFLSHFKGLPPHSSHYPFL